MPASIKLQEELGEDLQVIFVESQNTPPEDTERFILQHKWMGGRSMWTNERPVQVNTKGLPSYALISSDGKMLSEGNHISKAVKEMIAAEIEAGKEGPEGTPKAVQKAWKDYAKGKLAKALKTATKLREKPELAAAAEEAIETFMERTNTRIEALVWRSENGYLAEALDGLDSMESEVKGVPELEGRVSELKDKWEGDDLKAEREASQELSRFLEKLYADGYDKKGRFEKGIAKLVEKHAGTKAGERAAHIAKLAPTDH